MALLRTDNIVAADPAVTVAALAHLRVFFVQRNALTRLRAVGIDSETDGIWRRRLCLDSLDSLSDVPDELVHAADDDNALGTVENSRYTVRIAVDIIKLAVFGDGVGACEKRVGTEGLAVYLLNLLAGDALARAVEVIVIG